MTTGKGRVAASGIPPVYTELKDLHLSTRLAESGQANATIVVPESGVYDGLATRIQDAIRARAGVSVPIAADNSPSGRVPIAGNLIALGNRSTNRTIGELYNGYYTLLDLWYPGQGGHVVRSLHNPFGGGHNVLFVGGSDPTGVEAATRSFVETIRKAETAEGRLAVGWLMDIELGEGMVVPEDLREFETWEASAGYGSIGYFGWNSVSKRMAMYYMTGDPHHAREAVRLAFPDEAAMEEIAEIDSERIENKDEPLSGPYHYNTHMMILYWDLIEESPVFSDEDRLRITNAFSKQFVHEQEQRWRGQIVENLREGKADAYTDPPPKVGHRHGQWSSIALYCLGRYFQKDYPHPVWEHAIEAAKWHFAPLHHHAWVEGELDHLGWYNTATAPILSYMLLTGDRKPIESGVLATLLRGQEILASGREPDWALRSASIGFLNKAAYLTRDGRYREYLRRTGMDLGIFRLGQSFWPEDDLEPQLATDLVGKWAIHPIPDPMWQERSSGLPLEDSFLFGSFRSAADASGDFVLIKGMNGAYRNPYHTFPILDLRLDGRTLLEGFLNQLLVRADGMMGPEVAMDAALKHRDVLGGTAVVVGEVPKAAFCNWRRTLVQRVGRYALVVDDLTFRAGSADMEVEILWQGKGGWEALPDGGAVRIGEAGQICMSDPVETRAGNGQARMAWHGGVEKGEERIFFSLVGGGDAPLACARLGENAAALALPEPAVAAAGAYEGLQGELVVLAADHLHGVNAEEASLGASLFSASAPVQVDWDFESGAIEVAADRETEIRLAVSDDAEVHVDGEARGSGADGLLVLQVAAGRHSMTGAVPDPDTLGRAVARLARLLNQGRVSRKQVADAGSPALPEVPSLTSIFASTVGGEVVDLITVSLDEGTRICAAEGQTVARVDTGGRGTPEASDGWSNSRAPLVAGAQPAADRLRGREGDRIRPGYRRPQVGVRVRGRPRCVPGRKALLVQVRTGPRGGARASYRRVSRWEGTGLCG